MNPTTQPSEGAVRAAEHSPDPWVAESAMDFSPGRHDDERWAVHTGGLPLIAVVEQYRGEAKANAHLIALAPRMLRYVRLAAQIVGDPEAKAIVAAYSHALEEPSRHTSTQGKEGKL